MSLRVRVPRIMENMVMDGVQALVTEKLRAKWPEVECLIWPSVLESVAVEWLDSGQSEDKARNIAKMGCVVTQSRNLPTYFFSFWAFAALAKAFAGNEFGLNPRGYRLNSGRAAPLGIL